MILENHTSVSDDLLSRMLTECVDGYHALYPPASSNVEFIIVDSKDAIKIIRDKLTDDSGDEKDYDGNFIAPKERMDTLTILALLKEKNIRGAEQFFFEKERGSLRDASLNTETRAARGEKLMAFFEFAEMIQHEYSHSMIKSTVKIQGEYELKFYGKRTQTRIVMGFNPFVFIIP